MEILDTIIVQSGTEEQRIDLCLGDLTQFNEEDEVDILVVSAFPDDYEPTDTSLIGALAQKEVSVEELSRSKAVDLREAFSCWMSEEIVSEHPGIRFRRILCFEPLVRGEPPEVVGDIFRSLAPFLDGEIPVRTVAMPIVAAGDQSYSTTDILPPLLDAAHKWLSVGLPLKCLKIVTDSEDQGHLASEIFAKFRSELPSPQPQDGDANSKRFDVFVSYSQKNSEDADQLVKELQALEPGMRIFLDRSVLNPGTSWQQEIFEALDDCRKILVLFSPEYLSSKICLEEFNIAWARSRNEGEDLVFPIYLFSTELPTYMTLCQYEDCREGNRESMAVAASRLVQALKKE